MSGQIKLPLIDLSQAGDEASLETPEWASLRTKVRQALEEFGCFEASFDGVPVDLRQSMIGSLEELFDLPIETKRRTVSRKLFHGYFGQIPTMPLYEAIGIDNPELQEGVEEAVSSFWPEGHPTFSKITQSYSEKLATLDRIVRRMILESLGVGRYLDEHLNSTEYFLRFLKFQGPQSPEKQMGHPVHTDTNFLTVLYQNAVEGLEIQTKDGEWINYKPLPESFVIIVGQAFYAWANGQLHCPIHRVMVRGSENRYSTGLFTIPKEEYLIKAPDELVDEKHPLLFKPYHHYEFLRFYGTEEGAKAEFPLKAYCGV